LTIIKTRTNSLKRGHQRTRDNEKLRENVERNSSKTRHDTQQLLKKTKSVRGRSIAHYDICQFLERCLQISSRQKK